MSDFSDLVLREGSIDRELFDNEKELEFTPERYYIELYMADALGNYELADTLTTFGSWKIEGDFLIVWDATGIRNAYLLHSSIQYIKTVTAPGGKHAMLEENDEQAGDVKDGEEEASGPEAVHNGQA